jgi:hypothetical protein
VERKIMFQRIPLKGELSCAFHFPYSYSGISKNTKSNLNTKGKVFDQIFLTPITAPMTLSGVSSLLAHEVVFLDNCIEEQFFGERYLSG